MSNWGVLGAISTISMAGTGGLTIANKAGLFDKEPPSAVVADPRMITARNLRDTVVEQESRIAEQMKKVVEIVEKAKAAEKPANGADVAELKKLSSSLQKLSRSALDEHYRLMESTNEYVRELKHAPAGYSDAAKAWRSRATDYTNAGLKSLPIGYADDCEKLSLVYQERLTRIEIQLKRLNELLPFLRETRMSLQDFTLYLDQNPGIGAIDPTARYHGYLELYAKAHANFQSILTDYLAILRTPIPVIAVPNP